METLTNNIWQLVDLGISIIFLIVCIIAIGALIFYGFMGIYFIFTEVIVFDKKEELPNGIYQKTLENGEKITKIHYKK